jgi:hypothetical protein
MTGDTFEYAIKKDIRNNPIVREVDRERHREMWRTAGIGLFLVSVLLFWAWQHFELLRQGYRFEQMQREHVAEVEINRHLRAALTGANRTDGNPAAWNGDACRRRRAGGRARPPVACPPKFRARTQVDRCRTIVLRSGVPR